MRIHVIQHVPFEPPGNIEPWARAHGHTLSKTLVSDGVTFPNTNSFDWLVVMGGPMGTYEEDQFPFLVDEKRFVGNAIEADKTVLGVCLGAQVVADVLGGKVYPGPRKEIGWFPVSLTQDGRAAPLFSGVPAEFTPFHWHGDTFELPPGITTLATSALYENQAFQYGANVLALQFHLEIAPDDAKGMLDHCGAGLEKSFSVQDRPEILARNELFSASKKLLDTVLSNLERASG